MTSFVDLKKLRAECEKLLARQEYFVCEHPSIVIKLVDEIERLRDDWVQAGAAKDASELREFRANGVFGMGMNAGESLSDAANRWYAEFDKVRTAQHRELTRLRGTIAVLQAIVDGDAPHPEIRRLRAVIADIKKLPRGMTPPNRTRSG